AVVALPDVRQRHRGLRRAVAGDARIGDHVERDAGIAQAIVEAAVAELEQGIALGPLDPCLSTTAVPQRDPAGEVVIDRSDRASRIDAAGCEAALELGAPCRAPDSGHERLGSGTE